MTTITIDVLVSATKAKAWDVWTNAELVIHWNFASPEWCCPSATTELKNGGKFSYRMEAKDKSFGFDFSGIFTNFDPENALEFIMDDDRKVKVEFKEEGEETLITQSFETEDMNSVELQRNGWQAIMNNYKSYCESI